MATVVSICNLALGRIAISRTINAIDEGSQESATCAVFYEQVRDEVLRDHIWPFARRLVTLALVPDVETADEWAFAYRLPADCLRPWRIATGDRTAKGAVPYWIASDDAGALIYCDVEDAALEYGARIENASLFPPDFASAVAWRLASEIAGPLSQSGALADRAMRMYQQAVLRASATAGNEERPDAMPDAEAVRARA